MNKQNRKISKKLIALSLVVVLALGVAIPAIVSSAVESEKDTVARSVSLTNDQIPTSSLIVGTYVIHLKGLTQDIYDAAIASASEFNQTEIYYKSELANGSWFEISAASSLSDIIDDGTPVLKDVIEALEFTHMTNSMGITTNLVTGETTKPFSIPDPYDLQSMKELEELKLQYQLLLGVPEKVRTYSDKALIKYIKHFFEGDVIPDKSPSADEDAEPTPIMGGSKELHSEQTDEWDALLDSYETYRLDLIAKDASNNYKEVTYNAMANVDAKRRISAYATLDIMLQGLLEVCSGTVEIDWERIIDEVPSDDNDKRLETNTDVTTAISNALQAVAQSVASYEGKLITDGDLAVASTEYSLYSELDELAKAGDYTGCTDKVSKISHTDNVINGTFADIPSEISFLESTLLPLAKSKYQNQIWGGVGNDYKAVAEEGTSASVLDYYLELQSGVVSSYLTEYETLITGHFRRIENETAQALCLSMIDEANGYYSSVKNDEAKSIMDVSIDEFIEFLQSEYAKLLNESSGDSELDKLKALLSDTEKKMQECTDNNDLDGAAAMNAIAEDLQRQIDGITDGYLDVLNDPNASASDKAKAKAALGSGTTAGAIMDMADKAAEAIRDGDKTTATTALTALAEMSGLNINASKAGLESIKNALNHVMGNGDGSGDGSGANSGNGLSDKDLSDLLNGLGNFEDAIDAASLADGLPDGDGMQKWLDQAIKSLFGVSSDKISKDRAAAALVGVQWFVNDYASSSFELKEYVNNKATELYTAGNFYVYLKISDVTSLYVPLDKISLIKDYRYVFDDSKKQAVTAGLRDKKYYKYTDGSKTCVTKEKTNENGTEQSEQLSSAAKFDNRTLYISDEDSKKYYDVEGEMLKNAAQYSIIMTDEMKDMAQGIYLILVELLEQ